MRKAKNSDFLVMVTGACGMLGSDLTRALSEEGFRVAGVDKEDFDILDEAATSRNIKEAKPSLVIHCAAFTRVDDCEKEVELCRQINVDGTRNVARGAQECGAGIFVISTDYVFNGTKESPWMETDTPNPINQYGKSKLDGEKAALEANPSAVAIRTSWLYGKNGPNFVETIIRLAESLDRLKVVSDQRGRPTYTGSVSKTLTKISSIFLLENIWPSHKVINVCDSGECTWHKFAVEILNALKIDTPVDAVATSEYPRPAKRPANSVLDLSLLKEILGHNPPHWRDSLDQYLLERK